MAFKRYDYEHKLDEVYTAEELEAITNMSQVFRNRTLMARHMLERLHDILRDFEEWGMDYLGGDRRLVFAHYITEILDVFEMCDRNIYDTDCQLCSFPNQGNKMAYLLYKYRCISGTACMLGDDDE